MRPGRRRLLLGAAVAALAGVAGVGFGLYRASGRREMEALNRAEFLDLRGKTRALEEWRGKILLVNFWATWCAPCLEEIPMLLELRRTYVSKGFEVVGIGIDRGDKVGEMVAKLSIEYPVLLADIRGLQLMRELGNASGGLPYSVLLDRQLKPTARKIGALKRPEAEAMVQRAMQG